jgi:DMSO/TMAO reductase YedYZ molybdopterin-dependent catalytic subunit
MCRPLPTARYIVFYAFDDKSTSEPHAQGPGYFYGTIRLELAEDPQTILAYEMNGQPLQIEHGAPLRLRVETQLGFTMVKYIRAIEFIEDYKSIGQGQGGWREDYQYFSQEAGI